MKAVDYYYVQVVADACKKPSATGLVVKGEASSVSCSSHHSRIKCNAANSSSFGPARYKLWAFIVILLLALWSMFTGSVTLNLSAAAAALADDLDYSLHADLDILEVEERLKMVRHMWDAYTHSNTIKLPRFWQRAFEAAYEDLTSDVSSLRNNAVLEIAKMSMFSLPSPPQSATPQEKRQRPASCRSQDGDCYTFENSIISTFL